MSRIVRTSLIPAVATAATIHRHRGGVHLMDAEWTRSVLTEPADRGPARQFACKSTEPTIGLEPMTPSLPWKFRAQPELTLGHAKRPALSLSATPALRERWAL